MNDGDGNTAAAGRHECIVGILTDWVSTFERQPNHEQRVIIWFENDFHRAIYSDKNKRFYIGSKTAVQATHWMIGPGAPVKC